MDRGERDDELVRRQAEAQETTSAGVTALVVLVLLALLCLAIYWVRIGF